MSKKRDFDDIASSGSDADSGGDTEAENSPPTQPAPKRARQGRSDDTIDTKAMLIESHRLQREEIQRRADFENRIIDAMRDNTRVLEKASNDHKESTHDLIALLDRKLGA